MSRSYASEFPDFAASDIPAELLDATQWADMSWHNESCPRFVSVLPIALADGAQFFACVWVEKPNRGEREDESHHRYSLNLLPIINGETQYDTPCEWHNGEEWSDVLPSLPSGGR